MIQAHEYQELGSTGDHVGLASTLSEHRILISSVLLHNSTVQRKICYMPSDTFFYYLVALPFLTPSMMTSNRTLGHISGKREFSLQKFN